jgi:transcriptional regulator with XRE-family HTH domain
MLPLVKERCIVYDIVKELWSWLGMETLRELRINLGWTIQKLAEEARITRQTVSSAEKGTPVLADTAKALADALGRGYGREIKPLDIHGLHIL